MSDAVLGSCVHLRRFVLRAGTRVLPHSVSLSPLSDLPPPSAVSGSGVRPELLVPQVPGLDSGVQLTDTGDLSWPIMFLYPEHSQSDLVREALDTDT